MAEHDEDIPPVPIDPADVEPHTELWFSVVSTLAEAMLTEALRGHDACCAAAFRVAVQLRGPWGELMICRWIDTLLHRLGYSATHDPLGQPRTRGGGGLTFLPRGSHVPVDVDDVPPLQRWAGRLVMARARLDLDTQTALLAAPPVCDPSGDDEVVSVLMIVFTTMQNHPALQGQTS